MLKEKLKINNKINANAVGADDPVCPHFEEPTQNKNLISNIQPLTSDYKGITLIALIITIIVMLILVGVTISVALNGGLFNKAKSAVTQTQKEVEREELTEIAIGAYDETTGKVNKNELKIDEKKYTNKGIADKVVVEGKSGTLWEIDLGSAEVKEYKNTEDSESIVFTLEDIYNSAYYDENEKCHDGSWYIPVANFYPEKLPSFEKNHPIYSSMKIYNISCSGQNTVPNMSDKDPEGGYESGYMFIKMEDTIVFSAKLGEESYVNEDNWETYKDWTFTITKWPE